MFLIPELYVCDFGGSTAVRRMVAQVNFSSCHHIFIVGIKERKAERKEHTDNKTRKRYKRFKRIQELGTRRYKRNDARKKEINDAGLRNVKKLEYKSECTSKLHVRHFMCGVIF
jgi:hypothetical protein